MNRRLSTVRRLCRASCLAAPLVLALAACGPQRSDAPTAASGAAVSAVAASGLAVDMPTKRYVEGPPGPFTIKGEYPNAPKDTVLRLITFNEMGTGEGETIATATVRNGRYTLQGDIANHQPVRLIFGSGNDLFTDFFLEPGEFTVEAPRNGSWVSGGVVNDTIHRNRSDPTVQDIHRKLLRYEGRKSPSKADLLAQMALEDQYDQAHAGALRELMGDERVPPRVKLWAMYFTASLEELSADERLKWIARLEAELGTHPVMTQMRDRVASMQQIDAAYRGVKVGMRYRDVTVVDAQGRPHQLSDVVKTHKAVLLDFWNTYCAPCRAEFPNMVKTRAAYLDRGFEIVSVCTDETTAEWLKTSKKEHMTWLNYYDHGGEIAESAQAYGVDSVPANYLIDANGIVVGKRVMGEELNAMLAKMLGSPSR